MDPENGQAAGVQSQPLGEAQREKPKAEEFIQFKEHAGFNFGMVLCWLAAILAIVATLFFWWISKNQKDALAEKSSERESLYQQLASPTNAEIEQKAQDFKASVTELKTAYSNKYSYTEFLPQFYSKLTKDTILTNMAITADGTLTVSGSTTSYRNAADLVVALKSWSTLKDVDLSSVSEAPNEAGKMVTLFAISAKIDKTAQKAASASTTGTAPDNTVSSSTEGGTNAEI